jgi:hypothetical protein
VDLQPGTVLYDVDEKSIGILIRRFRSYEDGERSYSVRAPEVFRVWVWESVWSKDGRVMYSEDGLINLMKADIIIILSDT